MTESEREINRWSNDKCVLGWKETRDEREEGSSEREG